MDHRPPLSVVIAARDGMEGLEPVLGALLPQAMRAGAETLLVGPVDLPASDGLRPIRVEDADIYRLRAIGIREARGEVVAIGEDHAVPRAGWCEAVLRAHKERPETAAIVGCLVNATDRTLSGRANFMAFAAPYGPPMRSLPPRRVPPLSALSLKRAALAELDGWTGAFETGLVPRLFAEGTMAADERIVVDHHQDHGIRWSIANGFHGARGSYGYRRSQLDGPGRRRSARWALSNWPRLLVREAREAGAGGLELAVVAAVATAVGLGGAIGSLSGPGRSPTRVA